MIILFIMRMFRFRSKKFKCPNTPDSNLESPFNYGTKMIMLN